VAPGLFLAPAQPLQAKQAQPFESLHIINFSAAHRLWESGSDSSAKNFCSLAMIGYWMMRQGAYILAFRSSTKEALEYPT
jgi:hypothetical protein